MKKERIDSMKEQLLPSREARAALEERLAAAPKKRPVPYQKYIAAAACAALLIAAYPVYRLTHPQDAPRHSYTLVQDGAETVTDTDAHWMEIVDSFQPDGVPVPIPDPDQGDGISVSSPVEGDRDVLMTPEELEEMLLQYGVTPEELEGKQLASTWALWWRYVHENGGQVTLAGVEEFLNREENRAWVEEIRAWEEQNPDWRCDDPIAVEPEGPSDVQAIPEPVLVDQQQALAQFAALMDRFEAEYGLGQYPEWYGGAWLDNRFDDYVARLVVAVVEEYDSKELCIQIQDWAGGDVIFTTHKYSLSFLRDLQEQVVGEMNRLGLFAGCGVDQELGRLELTLTDVTDEALILLAKLDPADDAIDVKVGAAFGVDLTDGADPTTPVSPETPVTYDVATGTVTVGPPIPTRDGGGDASTPPYNPTARPGEPGYIAPEKEPAEP